MGLSRRQFTKEFMLAAVRRLESGGLAGRSGARLESQPQRFASLAA